MGEPRRDPRYLGNCLQDGRKRSDVADTAKVQAPYGTVDEKYPNIVRIAAVACPKMGAPVGPERDRYRTVPTTVTALRPASRNSGFLSSYVSRFPDGYFYFSNNSVDVYGHLSRSFCSCG
jgi:hypothetical protein